MTGYRLRQRLLALAMLATLLFNAPLLSLADHLPHAGLLAYLFGSWLIVVVMLATLMRKRTD